uniref:M13 family metallopeptidase n=1 Tax=Alistipes megaguti TaxID=2364787 RepID=UPI001E6056CF|nr:M13 family metallopeptidase [Alistipes megaguti]
MKRIILLAATVACMAACQNNNSNKVPAIDLNNFDLSIAPNADFYQYATGGWQKNNPLKPEFSRYGSFDVLRENNEKRINELFQAMAKTEAVKGSVEQKISDLYKMGLDSVRLNAEGAAPLASDLQMVEGLTDRAQLPDLLARIHMALGNPFFGIGVMADLMDSNVNTLYVGQSGISMGDRDYYVAPENAKIKEAYKAYLVKLFTLCGYEAEAAATAAADALEIEDSLAEVFFSNVEQRDIPAQYNPMTREEFARTYDALDWDVYFKGMGLEQVDRLIVEQKRVMARVNEMLKTLPLEKIRHYLAAQIINGGASSLSDDFQTASFEFYGRTMSGQQEQKPRWKRAMSVPNGLLGEAVGEMYVAKYFPEKDKQRMTQLVKNLQTSLSQHIAALDWMSDATKAKAQEKLAAFTVKIGYPDKWKDYSTLEIDPAKSYYENLRDASIWATKDNLSKYGKPVDRTEWGMTPQTVNAYYNPTTNEICFPAAILQPPFYNPDADDAVNYGAIGVVIGHEMTHGFDDQGRQFDKDGNMNNWWSEEDSEAFKAKTEVLVKQFDAIEVLPAKDGQPALHANGALCLGENIADQGGLRVAWTAYQNSLEGKGHPAPIDGFTDAQRFYLAYATLWAQNIRDEEIARLTKLDVHSLGKWRVDATLRNIQDFYDAFNITDGAMFLPEEERVIIW